MKVEKNRSKLPRIDRIKYGLAAVADGVITIVSGGELVSDLQACVIRDATMRYFQLQISKDGVKKAKDNHTIETQKEQICL